MYANARGDVNVHYDDDDDDGEEQKLTLMKTDGPRLEDGKRGDVWLIAERSH